MLLLAGLIAFSSCDNEDLNTTSVFDSAVMPNKNEFDVWLDKNYREVYNIDFKYRYSDKEADLNYNVVPAVYDKSVALAILVKHIWLEAYSEAVSPEFMKTYVPRIIQLTGSRQDCVSPGNGCPRRHEVAPFGKRHLYITCSLVYYLYNLLTLKCQQDSLQGPSNV